MRWLVLAIAIGGGAGCGSDDAPGVPCTATSGLVARNASVLDGRGLPLEAWSWNRDELQLHLTYAYDGAGRLLEQRLDSRPGPGPQPPSEPGPDGNPDELTTVAYSGATAVERVVDLFSGRSDPIATYTLDDAQRVLRVAKVADLLQTGVFTFEYDAEGRVRRVEDHPDGSPSPRSRVLEYTYGGGPSPSSLRFITTGVHDIAFQYEEVPGQLVVRALPFDGTPLAPAQYEYDGAGRLTRASMAGMELEIAYGDDGAVAVRHQDGTLRTYSAGCGVVLEVPRGPRALPGPEPSGHFTLPHVPGAFFLPF